MKNKGNIKFIILISIFILFGAGLSAQAPTATTGAAASITSDSAVLSGTVNANGSDTTVTFEYGLDTSYGSTVAAVPGTVTGSTNTPVAGTLGELLPVTTYHYRVVATNASGTTYGADLTFITLGTAPSATTNPATAVTATDATLNGFVNANDYTSTVSFEWGTDTSYGNETPSLIPTVNAGVSSAVIANISGLTGGVVYHFRVKVAYSGGTVYGADMTFSSTPSAPTVTTNAASAISTTTAVLNGTVNPNYATTTVIFEYGTDVSYGSTINASPGSLDGGTASPVSASLSELTPNTTYHYRVVGGNSQGTTNGADMTFTTSALAPVATTDAATSITATTATLNGTVNANNASTVVTFEYGTDTSYGTTVSADQSPVSGSTNTAVSDNITGLTNGVTYHYRVVAQNTGGTTYGADMTFTAGTSPPTATTNAATSIGNTSATFNGVVNANGLSTGVSFEYGVDTSYGRSIGASPSPVTGSTNTAVSATPTDLNPGETYHYRVVATNAGGTVYGADMSFTTTGGSAPLATTQAATTVGATTATLNGIITSSSLATVTFEYGLDTSYGTTVTADQSPLTGTDQPVTATLSGLTTGLTYHYRVVAQNGTGTTYGADMTFTTGTAPAVTTLAVTNLTSTTVTLNGSVTAVFFNADVNFDYGPTAAYGTTVPADEGQAPRDTTVTRTYALSGLTPGTTYHYRIWATNALGTTYGVDMSFTTLTSAVATTDAATAIGATSATLNGTINANNSATTVTFEYGLDASYGQIVAASPGTVTGTTDTPVSLNVNLSPATTYHFRVVATNAFGTFYGADMSFTTGSIVPTAITEPADGISGTGATLNGTVNNQNYTPSTTVYFEYGTDTSYSGGTATADQSPVTGGANTAVTASITSLSPDTTYHYRVVAQNGNGISYGADMTFFTGAAPPTAITEAATGIGANGANLNGQINANNEDTNVYFDIGTDTSYGQTVLVTVLAAGSVNTPISHTYTGLTPSTTYHYRIRGVNAAGTTSGADMTFTTSPPGSPVVVTENATGVSGSSAVLNGIVNASNYSTTVTFQYGLTNGLGTTITADQSPVTGSTDTNVSANLSGLNANSTYYYRAVGVNSVNTVYGDILTFSTGGAGPIVTTNAATYVSTSTATLNGTVNANNSYTTSYFEYGETLSYGTRVGAYPGAANGVSDIAVHHSIGGLKQNTTYHYRVVAKNPYGHTYGADMTFTTTSSGASELPFGEFEKPVDGSTVAGNIPVTGWALDDTGIASVKIYREAVSGEGSGLIYIGDAVLIEGARPDVEEAYPNYPNNSKAGWGYMLLTNFLPNSGNGTFVLWVEITDLDGNTVSLGSKTIICDNANAVKPFGTIDTPEQGGIASGSSYVNFGWALTPQPNTIPFDGSTITVYVDGVPLGNPVYNQYRADIATLFPGYNNSNGAVGYFYLDTTTYADGVHTINWSVMDDAGNSDGIGTRFFTIQNNGTNQKLSNSNNGINNIGDIKDYQILYDGFEINKNKRGLHNSEIISDFKEHKIEMKEIGRIEFFVFSNNINKEYLGFLRIGDALRKLPIGSTIKNGKFYWNPGPGFIGEYNLIFVDKLNKIRKDVKIIIKPKYGLKK